MVRLIVGQRGKGKTTSILAKTTSILAHVNEQIKKADGNIVYLDKSSKHMYDLNNKIRLIDVSRYPIGNSEQFVGFVCGIISQDNDLEQMYFDNFLKISKLSEEGNELLTTINELEAISAKFNVDFYISISANKDDLAEELQDKILIAL